jgi:hypothetical protein
VFVCVCVYVCECVCVRERERERERESAHVCVCHGPSVPPSLLHSVPPYLPTSHVPLSLPPFLEDQIISSLYIDDAFLISLKALIQKN